MMSLNNPELFIWAGIPHVLFLLLLLLLFLTHLSPEPLIRCQCHPHLHRRAFVLLPTFSHRSCLSTLHLSFPPALLQRVHVSDLLAACPAQIVGPIHVNHEMVTLFLRLSLVAIKSLTQHRSERLCVGVCSRAQRSCRDSNMPG